MVFVVKIIVVYFYIEGDVIIGRVFVGIVVVVLYIEDVYISEIIFFGVGVFKYFV